MEGVHTTDKSFANVRERVAAAAVSAPVLDERPTKYADRIGSEVVGHKSAAYRKQIGMYLTPVEVADFIAAEYQNSAPTVRILDPAAGSGTLVCALVEALARRSEGNGLRCVEIVAYEIDLELVETLRVVIGYLQHWAARRNISLQTTIKNQDFLLENARTLRSTGDLFYKRKETLFDLVVANPPYFKLPKSDSRRQPATPVIHGRPNIYALFMAASAALLREGGELAFIIPRSFTAGRYFRLFREKFFANVRLIAVHIFNSRRDTFGRDDVLQENVIVRGLRNDGWYKSSEYATLVISNSHGLADLNSPIRRSMPLTDALDMASTDRVLRLPILESEDEAVRLVDSWPASLHEHGLNISTGPVVPFRATNFLDIANLPKSALAPLIWMHHVHAMRVHWPNDARKPQYIKRDAAERSLLVPNRNYVVLRRFSAKEELRRLVAAPWIRGATSSQFLGLENHLNYIHRPGGELEDDEAWGLAALLNSALLDTYFRVSSGNTQVSATELRRMPLPRRNVLLSIGRHAKALGDSYSEIDDIVGDALGIPR
ncbi:MAG: Eco57I restriction-modification methylase domain-containing protein [Candidatus Binataceae bacterium]